MKPGERPTYEPPGSIRDGSGYQLSDWRLGANSKVRDVRRSLDDTVAPAFTESGSS
jgi:hypothetical protein